MGRGVGGRQGVGWGGVVSMGAEVPLTREGVPVPRRCPRSLRPTAAPPVPAAAAEADAAAATAAAVCHPAAAAAAAPPGAAPPGPPPHRHCHPPTPAPPLRQPRPGPPAQSGASPGSGGRGRPPQRAPGRPRRAPQVPTRLCRHPAAAARRHHGEGGPPPAPPRPPDHLGGAGRGRGVVWEGGGSWCVICVCLGVHACVWSMCVQVCAGGLHPARVCMRMPHTCV